MMGRRALDRGLIALAILVYLLLHPAPPGEVLT